MVQDTIEDLKARVGRGDNAALFALAEALDRAKRHTESIDLLSRAASRGNAAAKTEVARRILVGLNAPLLPGDGVRLLVEAASQGSGAAAASLAVLAAVGAYRPQSWSDALSALQFAAERGHEPSQRLLTLLAAEDAPHGAAKAQWRDLRERVSIERWLSPPKPRQVNEDPLMREIPGFVSAAVCDWIIARAGERLIRAQIYARTEVAGVVSHTRTNTLAGFNLIDTDLLIVLVQARLARAAGIPFNQLEALSVLHYEVGEEFKDHYDFVDPSAPNYRQELARNGQRILTGLVYLNDDYEGGATEFARLAISHRGRKGDTFLFNNSLASGEPDLRTLHAGRPPTKGEKWVITQWFRNRPTVPGTALPH